MQLYHSMQAAVSIVQNLEVVRYSPSIQVLLLHYI